ncbi:MAG: hypothetical protein J6U54_09695 [Clostridiales bacterium]|nr:hypothetical protein [Clostridiales bacterium]
MYNEYRCPATEEPEDYLMHIGNWNSGRYRRGSGKRPFQGDAVAKLRPWGKVTSGGKGEGEGKKKDGGGDNQGGGKKGGNNNQSKDKLSARGDYFQAQSKWFGSLSKAIPKKATETPTYGYGDFDFSKYTIDELEKLNKRFQTEASYIDWINKRYPQKQTGAAKAKEVLEFAGSVATVGVTTVGLIAAIKELKGL